MKAVEVAVRSCNAVWTCREIPMSRENTAFIFKQRLSGNGELRQNGVWTKRAHGTNGRTAKIFRHGKKWRSKIPKYKIHFVLRGKDNKRHEMKITLTTKNVFHNVRPTGNENTWRQAARRSGKLPSSEERARWIMLSKHEIYNGTCTSSDAPYVVLYQWNMILHVPTKRSRATWCHSINYNARLKLWPQNFIEFLQKKKGSRHKQAVVSYIT